MLNTKVSLIYFNLIWDVQAHRFPNQVYFNNINNFSAPFYTRVYTDDAIEPIINGRTPIITLCIL